MTCDNTMPMSITSTDTMPSANLQLTQNHMELLSVNVALNSVDYSEDINNLSAAQNNIAVAQMEAAETIGNSIEKGSYQLSRQILQASRNIFLGLTSISSELERNNKMNEYYMLQKEIESYEDYLIENRIIKKVYSEMNLTKYENIKPITTKEALDIAYILRGDTALLEEIMFQKKISPFEALLDLCHDPHFGRLFCIGDSFYKQSKEKQISELWWSIDTNASIMKSEMNAMIHSGATDKPLYSDRVLNSAGRLNTIINKINFEMSLNDLRNLHEALRCAVRNHKIELAMSSQ